MAGHRRDLSRPKVECRTHATDDARRIVSKTWRNVQRNLCLMHACSYIITWQLAWIYVLLRELYCRKLWYSVSLHRNALETNARNNLASNFIYEMSWKIILLVILMSNLHSVLRNKRYRPASNLGLTAHPRSTCIVPVPCRRCSH